MDELKAKMKKLGRQFGKIGSGSSRGAFSGQGHRLGSSQPAGSAPSQSSHQPPPRRLVVPPPPPPAPPPQQQQQARQQQPTAPSSSSSAAQPEAAPVAAPPRPPPQLPAAPAAQQQQPLPPAPLPPAEGEPLEGVALAVGQLCSDPSGPGAAEVLSKLLRNIVASPGEPKFRRIRLSNPRIETAVVHASGGVELLLSCGFEILFEEKAEAAAGPAGGGSAEQRAAAAGQQDGGGEATEGYAVLAADADLAPLQYALTLLAPMLPAPAPPAAPPSTAVQGAAGSGSAGSGSAAGGSRPAQQQQQQQQARPARPPREWEAPRERNTQVLLPTSVERDVPEWFFQRTGAELKASFMAAVRRREQDQMLMTRATRERLKSSAARGPAPAFATVRVRFPEGISLQGEFGAGEPVAAVFAWVADSLSDPLHTYELVLPSRQTLETSAGSVRDADLLPSVALLFRWTGQSAVEMAQAPALRPELLRAARPATVAY